MIRLEHAVLTLGSTTIFDGAEVLVPTGARVGLLGRNGAGKTTLFRLIRGQLSLDSGDISVPKMFRMAYLPQHPESPPGETILRHVLESHPVLRDLEDTILRLERRMSEESDPQKLDRLVERHRTSSREFEARGGYDLEARVTGILTALGFAREDLLRELGPLSPGEKNRVALAKVLLAEADILLLDEPTNHLDFGMLEWLEGFLRDPPRGESGREVTVVVASHDRWFLNRFADHILELREGRLVLYRGDYDDFVRQRTEELERQAKVHRLQEEAIARDLEFIRRNFAAQKARQAKSREKRLDRMSLVEAPRGESAGPRLRFDGIAKAGDDVLRVSGLRCGHGDRVLLDLERLDLARGERVAILGPNGCGKTTLLKCLVGTLAPMGGEIHFGTRTRVGYYEQELAHVSGTGTLFDSVHDLVPTWTNQAVRDLLAAFLFRGEEITKSIDVLSGGERARMALIRLILSGANLLVLDEPTNHLDVYARGALEEALSEFPETILFVSHDRYFIERVNTRILAFVEGTLREFVGGYEEYRAWAREAALPPPEEERAPELTPPPPDRVGQARAAKSQETKLIGAISRAEEALRGAEEACGLEENYRNPEVMRRLKREIDDLRSALEGFYRDWEALESPG